MYIALEKIHASPGNTRRITAGEEADRALRASLETIGLLQPILVVPLDREGEYELRAGHRRVAAAKSLGWSDIQAVVLDAAMRDVTGAEVPETAISAAENMVRAPMHPVDQWRAINDLRQSCDYSLETAAAALGVPPAMARRMDLLGKMDPAILTAIGQGNLPDSRHLRLIAMAPVTVQQDALKRGTRANNRVDWMAVAEGCTCRRIPLSRALFDEALIEWDEDLFAEPSDPDRFTTTDVEGFMRLQTLALERMAAKSNGHIVVALADPRTGRAPKGWAYIWDEVPKRWRKDDPRCAYGWIDPEGYQIGRVHWRMAQPVAVAVVSEPASPGAVASPSAPERAPITKAVQTKLASIKNEAVKERLAVFAGNGPSDMLRALLLLFACDNVTAGHGLDSPHRMIPAMLVTPDGQPNDLVSDDELCALAARLIGNAIRFDHPTGTDTSGVAAEWIATLIGAEVPRTDTAEILQGLDRTTLYSLAQQHRFVLGGTLTSLRAAMVGKLPDWRAVGFGAAGPVSRPDDLAEPAENEDADSEESDVDAAAAD